MSSDNEDAAGTTKSIVIGAIVFVAALAWRDFFKDSIDHIWKFMPTASLPSSMRTLSYTILTTAIAVALIHMYSSMT